MEAVDPSDALEQELRNDVRGIFDKYDKNSDGALCWKEVAKMLQELGQNPTTSSINTYMKNADKDGDSELDFEEFWQVFRQQPSPEDTENDLKEALRYFSNSDTMSRDVLKSILADPENEEAEVDNVLAKFDVNRDGVLDIDEFTRYLQHPV